MKIAMFAPYFATQGGGLPNYYEYWQKAAAANSQIDFFIPTNLDVSNYKKYANIHYILMTADEFWDKVQGLFDFEISRSYYKSGEYRPLFAAIFKDYIKGYDYWGLTEFDVIYGDILGFIRPYIDNGVDVIGETGTLRFIKNTDKLRDIPFYPISGFKHPLTLEIAYSNCYCWYFDEEWGMGIRYYQNGIEPISVRSVYADTSPPRRTIMAASVMEGDLGIMWDNGKLFAYNDKGETKELIAAHFQKRKLSIDSVYPGEKFCVIPNRIINDCDPPMELHAPTLLYSIRFYRDALKRVRPYVEVAAPEYRSISAELHKYCENVGIAPKRGPLAKMYYALRRLLFRR